MDPSLLKKVDYMEDRLVQDPAYRCEGASPAGPGRAAALQQTRLRRSSC